MKKVIWALAIVHALSIAYTVLFAIAPKLALTKANLFLDQSAMPAGIEVAWYVKYTTDHIIWCTTYILFAWVAKCYNTKLFLGVGVFVVYHLLDFVLFIVNFSQSWWLYYVSFCLVCMAIVVVFLPVKNRAKVVSME